MKNLQRELDFCFFLDHIICVCNAAFAFEPKGVLFVHDQCRNCRYSPFIVGVKFCSTIYSFNEPGPICMGCQNVPWIYEYILYVDVL